MTIRYVWHRIAWQIYRTTGLPLTRGLSVLAGMDATNARLSKLLADIESATRNDRTEGRS